jgi:hypothetical protein
MRIRPKERAFCPYCPKKTDSDRDKRPIPFGTMQPFGNAMLCHFKSVSGHGRLSSITARTSAIIGD